MALLPCFNKSNPPQHIALPFVGQGKQRRLMYYETTVVGKYTSTCCFCKFFHNGCTVEEVAISGDGEPTKDSFQVDGIIIIIPHFQNSFIITFAELLIILTDCTIYG